MKTAIAAIAVFLITGCSIVTINYPAGKVDYVRVGDQNIGNLQVIKYKDVVVMVLQGQQAKGKAPAAADVTGAVIRAITKP